MAPRCTNSSVLQRSSKGGIRLRKPVVEKMRRDRINSCIEQLRIILEKEFHKQEPNSKLEKADILEMTVSFLRQQLQPGLGHNDFNQDYPPRWRDSVHFLSAASKADVFEAPLQGIQLQQQQLHQAQRASNSPVCSTLKATALQDSSSGGTVWRPW
ncbi:transcription factor HES-5-like [Antennarius striatus]|uniref:transcription factor HES-5-like n=1 Tax=Antennarius striatus TaxID=241820 RepID=UPI0035B18265